MDREEEMGKKKKDKGFFEIIGDSFKEALNTPEFKQSMNNAQDQFQANFYLLNNNLKELTNTGLSLKEAKVMVKEMNDNEQKD